MVLKKKSRAIRKSRGPLYGYIEEETQNTKRLDQESRQETKKLRAMEVLGRVVINLYVQ